MKHFCVNLTAGRARKAVEIKVEHCRRGEVKCDGTRAETRFRLSAKRTSPFKSDGEGGVSSVDCWQPRCAPSAVVMLDSPCSEVVWRVLANHSIRQLPLHFPFRASPYAITFQLDSNNIPWEHDLLFLSTTNWRFGGVTWGDFMKCHLGACYTKRNLARKLLSRDKSARCQKNI